MFASTSALMKSHSASIFSFSAAGMASSAGLLSSAAAAGLVVCAVAKPAIATAANAETGNLQKLMTRIIR